MDAISEFLVVRAFYGTLLSSPNIDSVVVPVAPRGLHAHSHVAVAHAASCDPSVCVLRGSQLSRRHGRYTRAISSRGI